MSERIKLIYTSDLNVFEDCCERASRVYVFAIKDYDTMFDIQDMIDNFDEADLQDMTGIYEEHAYLAGQRFTRVMFTLADTHLIVSETVGYDI